jgi:hypothetical protein
MTDEQLDRVVRNADPYRTDVIGQLDGAGPTLLEEIMSSAPEVQKNRRAPVRRLVTAAAAAAVLVSILGVTAVLRHDAPADRRQAQPSVVSPAAPQARTYSAFVLKAAEQNPRLLIDEPGWKATTVYGFAEKTGTIAFTKGDLQLEMNWYPADEFKDRDLDRKGVSDPQAVTVAGRSGSLFTYSANDWAIMLKPKDGTFVELRTGGNWKRADFDRTVAHIVQADVPTWLAALPPEIVTPDKADAAADRILAGVPLPPSFDKSKLATLGTNDPYQFGANVTSLVGCGWIEEWLRARQAGDTAAQKKAAQAMAGSHKWKILNDMNAAGDWPEVFWELSDQLADGREPLGYKDAIGCH